MAVKAWIHRETGLPCFYLDGPDAAAAVYDGERLINPADTANQASAFCDPFAPPGVATTYTVGARRFTLTRRGEGYAVTSLDSRQRAVVSYIGDDAPATTTRAPRRRTSTPAARPSSAGRASPPPTPGGSNSWPTLRRARASSASSKPASR